MAAYVVVEVEVADPDAYRAYTSEVPATLKPFGGRFIVRGGTVEVLEGSWNPQRFVILEFPSVEHARAWHGSPAYQAILPIRHQHANTRYLAVVSGYDQTPPPSS